MFIEKRLWDWLNWVGFDQEILDPEVQDNRSYLLREDFLEGLFKGAVFKDILLRIASQHDINFEKQQILDHITPGDTPTSLGYNWDLILEFLSQIGFTVDKQIVDKMRSKDNSVMKDFLSDLTDTFPVKRPAASAANNKSASKLNSTKKNAIELSLNENFDASNEGFTTVLGSGRQEGLFRNDVVDKLDLMNIRVDQSLRELTSIPEILIVAASKHLNMKPIEAASLFTNNSRFFSLLLIKGLKQGFAAIIGFLKEVISIYDHLIDLALRDPQGQSVFRILQTFKSGFVSRSTEVAKYTSRLYSNFSYGLLDAGGLDLAYQWFSNPSTGAVKTTVLCLYRHSELVQDVTTFIIDIARNHLDSFFEEVLPGIIQNDLEYFRVINLIFRPILAREQSRVIVERTGTIGRWCQLAMALLNSSDITAMLKTDCLNFLTNCWGTLPDYFETLQNFSQNLIESLINLSQTNSVLHSICVFKLFELLEKFSKDRRKFAPEIYKALIFLLMSSDKNVSGRDRILQGFINLFLKTDIPSIVLLDSYLRHFQTNHGVSFDINVFDLDFLKFLVRDKKITVKFKIIFFDIFCKLMLGSLYGTAVFMELVATSQELVSETEIGIVMKFVDVGLKFYTTTYKNRKIVIGHVSDVQTIQMHKRALVCHYIIALLDSLPLNSIQEQIKDATLEAYIDILSHYDKDKKKRKNDKGKIQGLREILGKFGAADEVIEKYMREKNIFFGSEEEVAKMKRSMSPGSKLNVNDLDPSEVHSLMSGDKSSFKPDASLVSQSTNSLMIRNKLAALKKKEKEVGITKLELYLKMRENGIVDDPSGIEKLENFKSKLRERQNRQFGTMVKVKMKDLKLKDNLKTLLDQRRVQLGVESSFIDDEHPERLIYPLNEYEKIRGKFETNKDLVQIELVRLEDLEKVDSEAITERLTKCRKVIRMVFSQYSNCLKGFDKGADFERIKSQLNRLSRMEFWKFIKDFALTNFITPEEVATIYKEINVKFMHNTVDLNYLGYPAMKHLFFQTACFMFSRPPIDLSHLPPAYAFDKLIELIIKKLKDSGHETKFFDEPDKYNLFGDPEVHDFLNQKLAEDPDYQLPTKYTRMVEKKVSYIPRFGNIGCIPESYHVCYSVINDLFKLEFDLDLFDMEAVVEETFKVRAKTYKELEMEQHPRPTDAIHKKTKAARVKSPKIVTNRRVLRIDHTNIEPNITIKLGIQDSTLKDYDIAQDCGIVLEELIRAAERGEESYILLDKYDANKLDNSVVREREINQKAMIEMEQERIKKLENRNAMLKKEIIDKKGDLDSHGRHKEKLEKIEKEIREKRIVKVMTGKWGKKDLEELEQYKINQKEKVEENRQKIKDLKEKVKEAEEAKRKEEIKMKDEEFRKFNLKRVRGYQQDYREKEVEFKNRSASMERARDYKSIHTELRLASAKKVEKFKERKQKTRQKKEAISKRIDALTKSPLYPAFLQRHLLQLRTIFDTYIQMELNSLNSTATADTLSHSSIQQFLRDFEIVPVVLKPNEEDKMTKEMISEKIGSTNMEFDFNFFKDFLHRLVVERPVLFEKAFDQRVATLKQFDDAAQQQAQYQEKIRAIKARAKEIELKKQKKKETLQVKDNPKAVDLRKKEEEAKQAILRIEKLKAKRAQEEEYVAKVSSNPVRLLEGLIAYLNVPSVKSQIQETINVNQSAKTLPTREIIKRKLRTLLDKLDDVEKLDKDEKGGIKGQENNKSRSIKDVEEEENEKDNLEND